MSFIVRRVIFYLVAAWVALTINFFIPRAMPGNAVQAIMAKFPNLTPSAYRALEAMLGVGHPGSIWHQYWSYLVNVSHLNFGTDVSQYPASVSSLLAQTIPWTITLVGTATVIAFAIGTALGIMAGWRRGGWLDRVLPGLMFFQAMPYFFLALILLELLAVRAHLLPLGLGFPTLVPAHGNVSMLVASVPGVKLSGMIFDAGPVNSPALLQVGFPGGRGWSDPADPTLVQDVFFRVGGATPGRATDSLAVNSSQVILDNIWAWRADHGNGVGWTSNVGDTGVVVNGNDVTAYGLFVEHYQKAQVIWNGRDGTDIFFQNEMPYDPPSQAAWMENPSTDGYPAFLITQHAADFSGYGMGSYSFFNQGVPIFATNAFEAGNPPGLQLHDLLTIFLSTAGSGGIDHVVNGTGGSSTIANPDTPVNVVSYP